MPLPWLSMGLRRRAHAIIDNIQGLTDDDIAEIWTEWGELDYPGEGAAFEREALADLQQIAVRKVLERTGRWKRFEDSVLAQQRAD